MIYYKWSHTGTFAYSWCSWPALSCCELFPLEMDCLTFCLLFLREMTGCYAGPWCLNALSQCSIDLKKNVLVIGTTGSQTTFLPEGELPECARLAYGAGREDVRPEEIADQELAEAIQKSVEEAGTRRSPVEILNLHSFLAVPRTVLSAVPLLSS